MNVDELCMGCMSQRGATGTCPHCGYIEGTQPSSLLHLPPRTVLHEQYVIGRVLGHGGFGITYIGWDKLLERKLAVKEYFPAGIAMRTSGTATVSHYSGTQQKDYDYGLERYLEEARLLARFSSHPHILSVLNFFKDNGTAYIVTEFLEGHTFQKHLELAGERIGFEETMQSMLPVLRALEDVHAAGILHRDVSPDNIHIGTNRQIKLLDFGAARLALGERSKNLSVILKEGYAPPEQYHSRGNQGPWTDVYACAATIYRAITGRHVPPALDRMAEDDLRPPISLGVAMSLREEEALLRALSFNAIDRYQSMREFREALTLQEAPLQRLLSGTPLPAKSSGSSLAEAPTVRASGPSAAIPVTHAPPAPPKPKVPAWVWSVLGGAVVLAVLFALRPKASEPESRPGTPVQAVLQVPSPTPAPAPSPAPSPTPPPTPSVTAAPTPSPTAAPPPKPAGPTYAELVDKARRPELGALEQMTTLEQAIQLNPNLPEAYDLLAQNLLYSQNKPAEAEVQYRKAIEAGGRATFQVILMQRGAMAADVRPGKLSISRTESTFVDHLGQRSYTTKNEMIAAIVTLREAMPNLKLKMKMKMMANQAGFQVQYRSGVSYNFLCTSGSREAERDLILKIFRGQ